jgi:L-gulono-1,4-lactone dehydrogenase
MWKTPRPRRALRGYGGDRAYPARIETPRSREELRELIGSARRSGRSLRVFGARHTLNDAWCTDGIAVDGSALDGEATWLGSFSRPLLRVPAGWRLSRLNPLLERHGLALASIPNYTGVTIAGALATGSHGASIHQQPFGACVRALEMLDGRGRHLWIESERDPVLQEMVEGERVSDDALFDASTVNLGALGVVLSVVIEPVPTFWLSDERSHASHEELLDDVTSGRFALRNGYSALVHPYASHCAIGRGDLYDREPTWTSDPASALESLRALVEHLRCIPRFWIDPHRIPDHLVRGLHTFAPPRRVHAIGHRIMGTDFSGLPPRGVAMELAFPIDTSEQTARLRAGAELTEVLRTCRTLARRGRFVGGYLSVRFGKRWDAVLSPTESSDMLFVEVLMLDGTPFFRDTLRDLEEAHGRNRHRRHLALIHSLDASELPRLYPRIELFHRALVEFDPDGVFQNELTARLGLHTPARATRSVG